jgi:Flp pilus assembly protein TadG
VGSGRSGRAAGGGRGRRGATIVLVALLLVALVGIAGIAIDFGRLYLFRGELQTVADASALAGAMELAADRPRAVADTAASYAARNTVEQQMATVGLADVTCGRWDFATNAPVGVYMNCEDLNDNAVRVAARYTATYTLSSIFKQQDTLQGEAYAARGYVGSASCVKPWAISYQFMLRTALGMPNPPANYALTINDVRALGMNGIQVVIPLELNPLLPADTTFVPVRVGTGLGLVDYLLGLTPGCNGANQGLIGRLATSLLTPFPLGGLTTVARDEIYALCGGSGPAPAPEFACPTPTIVPIVLYDAVVGGQYRVRHVGALRIEGYCDASPGSGATCSVAGGSEAIIGVFTTLHFSLLPGRSTFSGEPAPIWGRVALVEQ